LSGYRQFVMKKTQKKNDLNIDCDEIKSYDKDEFELEIIELTQNNQIRHDK
jgi:hypothetical protein